MGPANNFIYTDTKGTVWYLHTKDVTLRNGRVQTIYFFAKDAREGRCELPADMIVMETARTEMPVLRRVR